MLLDLLINLVEVVLKSAAIFETQGLNEVSPGLSVLFGVVSGSTSPLNGLQVVCIILDGLLSVHESLLVLLELQVALGSVGVDKASHLMV